MASKACTNYSKSNHEGSSLQREWHIISLQKAMYPENILKCMHIAEIELLLHQIIKLDTMDEFSGYFQD